MKSIIISDNKSYNSQKLSKTRVKIQNLHSDFSNNIIKNMNNYDEQVKFINKLYLEQNFDEKKFILSELKNKINSYKEQDKKKNLHEIDNLITLDNVIEKLVKSKLKCYYCNKKMLILFDKVRDNNQWTLDRINNFDEHTDYNTIVCCLECNLQRRRKNSEKFKFTKQLQTNQIKVKKI